jgi:hypothetical protein
MDKKDILEKNKLLQEAYNRLLGELNEIKSKAIAPCEYCKYNYKRNYESPCQLCYNYIFVYFEDKSIDKSDDKK